MSQGDTQMEDLLSTADAARILGVTPGAVRLMRRRGSLDVSQKTVGGIHLFSRKDVEELARKRVEAAQNQHSDTKKS